MGRDVYILVSNSLNCKLHFNLQSRVETSKCWLYQGIMALSHGSANVGKSVFISALLKTMALRDPAA
uniref:Uncharacterized protein n=1 Tax=Salix viminalis TaxID=40686 RepID=A0A6N2N6S9_SALVM